MLPLLARICGRVKLLRLIDRAAYSAELAPPVIIDRPAALALPGEFERAIGFYETREMEWRRVAGGQRREGATCAYRLDRALVAEGAVYKGLAAEFYRRDGPKLLLSGPVERRPTGLLVTNQVIETYFGDWLLQSFTAALLAERIGVPPVRLARPPWQHEAGYCELLGIVPEPIVRTRFDHLWIVDDRGMNDDRAARFKLLRDRLRSVAAGKPSTGRVLIARGQSGKGRGLINDRAVVDLLAKRGFEVITPETMLPAAIVAALAKANVVVTIEGSAQNHALLACPAGATLVILQPPRRFTAPGKDWGDLVGLRYAFVVGEPTNSANDDFEIDLARLTALLDMVEAG